MALAFSNTTLYLFQVFWEYIHPQARDVFHAPLQQLWRELQGKTKQNSHSSVGFVCNFQIGPAGVAQEGTFGTSGPCSKGLSL